MANQNVSLRKSLLEAAAAGLLAFVLFGPITGLLLNGYKLQPALQRPLIIAAIVALGRFIASLALQTASGKAFLERAHSLRDAGVTVAREEKGKLRRLLIPLLIAVCLIFPFVIGKYWLTVACLALIYVLLGLGLNIVVGLAGLLVLGYVAFYAIGAYGLALGAQYLGLGFWSVLPLAGIASALLGLVLGFPVLRMHGDYLAVVTLGFGEIIRLVLTNMVDFTGGPSGASAPPITFFGLAFAREGAEGKIPFHEFFHLAYNPDHRFIFTYLVLFVVVCLTVLFVVRLKQMPMGRAWEALRENEIACRSLGMNHVMVKLSAFMMAAMIGGIAGVFFATLQGFINPTSFTFFESALILAIVVMGGLGSTVGVIVSALVLTVLPEVLRGFSDYRVLIFGMLMVLMMIWRPRGLLRIKRRAFEVDQLVDDTLVRHDYDVVEEV
jgi:branched-chain amino acid transport system permease protein